MSSESSRFQHLLQPIRDLSKNWNIDLAQELEEYLDELENLTIAFDANEGPSAVVAKKSVASQVQLMNFAEAALLIQGTSMIYSRKVEYLYALVFQTLAHLSKQQEDTHANLQRQRRGENPEDDGDNANGGDDQDNSDSHLDILANPLPIYEDVDEARNITLKRPSSSVRNAGQSRPDALKTKNSIQASIALMGSLVPDERDHGETFKLLSCHLHPSGVLMLDEASRKYLKDEVTYAGASKRMPPTPAAPRTSLIFDEPWALDDNRTSLDHGTKLDFDGVASDDDGGDDGHYDFDDPADGGDVDPFLAPPEEVRATTTTRTRRKTTAPDAKDPWAPLDPYDASKSTVRPFRKGRSYPVRGAAAKKLLARKNKKLEEDGVDGVDDPAFKERFLLGANRPQWSTWVWNELDERALEQKFKKKYCKAPCLMTSCDALWRLETKWKGLMRRSTASTTQSAQAILLQEQTEEEQEEMHAMTLESGLINDAYVMDPVTDDVNNDDHGGDDDDYDDVDDHAVDFGGDEDAWDSAPHRASMSLLDGATSRSNDAHDSEKGLSYEEICRQHLEEFMKGTEKYMRETDLTRQVNEWQDKLDPILKEQNSHPLFDIHHYGREILGHLESKKPKRKAPKRRKRPDDERSDEEQDGDETAPIPFGEIVSGLNQFEVCRMFLASLQLANNGNVHLVHGNTAAEQEAVPFEMQLLTTDDVYNSLQGAT
ncbi:hypothetical protein Poli38472_013755 [Pythium oligandrum]|uniref:Condensin-2 complex subunit H2 n=1 Tax=Pythium oligandrum TaxID=41045 RepID=A0A8K1FJ03_PYTOL|nr:hypothetical protein Poli38472_013755 [Pythium oligandrum]|eukprot:TMW61292.1 hypothetical protein Poli38472_013755 [Pythium oligandrum]